MNHKAAQRLRSHEDILRSAATLLRSAGVSGARVADVMKGAGLTVGGFYAHFASKEALIDEALRRTGRELRAQLFARLDDEPAEDRAEIILKRYLSSQHRDRPQTGCPFPALTSEIAGSHAAHRPVFAEQLDALARELQPHLPGSARPLALGLVALMIGGLGLSRALGASALSDEVLRACRQLGRLALHAARHGR